MQNKLEYFVYNMIVNINKKQYSVNTNEFTKLVHEEYNNLHILSGLGEMERLCSLIGELMFTDITALICFNPSHGGFIPIELADKIPNIYILNSYPEHKENIEKNISSHKCNNIRWKIDSSQNYNNEINEIN